MKNKNILKRISVILFCLSILFSILPMTVNATTSVPGATDHTLTGIIEGTFEGGYDSQILVYCTPNVNGDIHYKIMDNSAMFGIPAHDSSQWYFDGWRTWYDGIQLGAGVVTSNKANPWYDDDTHYFTQSTSISAYAGEYYDAGSMYVLKEDTWKVKCYL